jgi:hypothetical protein
MSSRLADNFTEALEYSRKMRDTFLSRFYQKYSVEGRYVYVDKSACSTVLQKQLAIDTVMQAKDGGSLCIEEKIEQWPGYKRDNFALETDSCTVVGREKQGWMHYAQADYLLYAFAYEGDSGLDVYFIDFPKLRTWFWNLPVRYPTHVMEHTLNHTRFEKVPIRDVRKAVPAFRYLVTRDECTFIPKRGGN